MFIYTVRASTLRFFMCIFLCLAVFVALISIGTSGSVYASADGREVDYSGIKDNDDRVRFIESFGIKVNSEPVSEESFTVPAEFDRVIEEYNQIQKRQGLDLSRYQKKRVTHYAYEVTNYDHEGAVYVNLIIHRGKVIAADISSAQGGGFVLPLLEVDTNRLK